MIKFNLNFPKIGPELDPEAQLSLGIIVSFATSLLTYLSIISSGSTDPVVGTFGAIIGSFILQILGKASIVLPLGLLWLGFILIRLQKNLELGKDANPRLGWGLTFLLASLTGLLNIVFGIDNLGEMAEGGGLFGYFFYPLLFGGLSSVGGAIMLISIGLFGFFLVSQLTFVKFMEKTRAILKNPSKFWDLVPDLFEPWKAEGQSTASKLEIEAENFNDALDKTQAEKNTGKSVTKPKSKILQNYQKAKEEESSKISGFGDLKKEKQKQVDLWKLPPFGILKEHFGEPEAGDVEKNINIISTTLKNFGIEVEMGEVVTGPTVSQYTFKPASGVKLSAIDSLQRDLALALAADSLRLEAPIPGKSLVGVEIPNKLKSQVRLRDVLQTRKFVEFDKDLPVVVGVDVAGQSLVFSISKMPHLLVAGATGSGKSVWLNSMLLSLLYRYNPEELELILIDMKRVELKLYEGIPHLLAPVITDSDKAINALKWSIMEMDRRYKILEEFGKRNIADYNLFVKETKLQEDLELLPFVVVVIDELGDLMITAKNEVEPIIVRLTQMSRAVGIHLILGTQRPDTHVITGLIKANIPTRIAFTVVSQVDSRVILDQGGAEKLLGQGDGLLLSPMHMKPIRFQGCLVEELEVRKAVSFWRDQVIENNLETNLDSKVTETPKTKINVPGMTESPLDEDSIYEKAKAYVISQQGASTSMLQTAFGIGYPKARKVIEMLEQDGIVGPTNGSKPREVYVEAETYHE